MANVIKRHIYPLLIALTACLMTGCLDDTFSDYNDIIGEGDADLRATVEFKNLTPALDTRTPGNAVGAVSNLQMIIYKVENGETTFYKRVVCNSLSDYKLTTSNTAVPGDQNADDPKAGQFDSSNEITDHADYSYQPLPYGRYKIYAVANVPGLTDEDCKTEETLKSMSFEWNETDIAANNAMFGYFTKADNQASNGFEAPILIINKPNINIHAWIKRMVSKVTVAFDPSELKESVTVYIKSVTIRDIPKTCFLGKNNSPSDTTQLFRYGEQIKYYTDATANDYSKWGIVLQKGSGVKGSSHSNTADALFFFENMQGDYEGNKLYYKPQIDSETGTSIDAPGDNLYGEGTNDFKDRIPYGSYIEVEAYYVSKNTEKLSSGKIIYRFMLGKNITYNYDAQRNYHYKLTLKLRGFANEADWHISYTEPTPSVYTPDVYYISYLYGQDMNFPVRVITDDPAKTKKYRLKATIIENPWWPYDETAGGYPPLTVGNADEFTGFAWMKGVLERNVPNSVIPAGTTPYYSGNYKNFAGFLSLRKPEMENGKYKNIEFNDVTQEGSWKDRNYGPVYNDRLQQYYFNHKVGEAAYTLTDGERYVGHYNATSKQVEEGTVADGKYSVSTGTDGSVNLIIPMYTRPQKMVSGSDFSGNNPYGSYLRRAIVRFELLDENGETVRFTDLADNDKLVEYRDVPIQQVRRIENPKAIYRKYDSTEPFEVKLMELVNRGPILATQFTPVRSDGPWRASIMATTEDFVELSRAGQKTVTKPGEYITGSSGDIIDFSYKPAAELSDPNAARCALILVEYNDYTCRHIIFVRQGYDNKTELAGTKWSCYNVYAAGGSNTSSNEPEYISECRVALTESPLSMGSLLKRCQYNYSFTEDNPEWLIKVLSDSIDKKTNKKVYYNETYLNSTYVTTGDSVSPRSVKWGGVQGYGWRNYNSSDTRYGRGWASTWKSVGNKANKKLTVPTYKQFEDLRDQCDFGFGIAYGDGAKETATSLTTAYEFSDSGNSGAASEMGVRACIAYDSSTGWNILFPLGKYGNGRRPAGGAYHYGIPAGTQLGRPNPGAGTLSYGGMSTVLYSTTTTYRPITYNHFRSPGAIYWIKLPYLKITNGAWDAKESYAAWDINYFTLTFTKHDIGTIGNFTSGTVDNWTVSDALPIKLVYTE